LDFLYLVLGEMQPTAAVVVGIVQMSAEELRELERRLQSHRPRCHAAGSGGSQRFCLHTRQTTRRRWLARRCSMMVCAD